MRPNDSNALDGRHPHHQDIVLRFYAKHPELGKPLTLQVYDSWADVRSQPHLTATTCVFVDGGILNRPLDLGYAILINDGGIVKAPIKCGLCHRDGGIAEAPITERLKPRPAIDSPKPSR